MAFCLVIAPWAGSVPSTNDYYDVFIELLTSGDDNWTKSLGYEAFNFSINNTNASLELSEINISVPSSGGNALFSVNVSTIAYSDGMWNCTNASSDGNGNADLIRCNASSGNELVNGSEISILFYSTAPSTSVQENCEWRVWLGNATNVAFSIGIYSGVDGVLPTIQYEAATTSAGNYSADYLYANVSANDTLLDTITIFLYNSTALVNKTMSVSSPFFQNFTGLPNDFYYLNATANDSVGNEAPAATRTMVLDTAQPSITIHSPDNMTYDSGTSLPVQYSAGDNIGLLSCKYSIDSASNTTLTGCANTTANVGEGAHNITMHVEDTTGNLKSATQYFTVDLTAPGVTLIEPSSSWDEDGNVIFYYKPADALSPFKNCSLWLSGNTGSGWAINRTNTTILNNQTNNFSVSGMSANGNYGYGSYKWNVQCYDDADRAAFSAANKSVYIGDRSNIFLQSITPDSGVYPYVGLLMLVEVNISNNGTADVTNMTNVTFCFGTNSANPCDSAIFSNTTELVPAADLQVGETHSINYRINITGSGGDYYVKAIADPANLEVEQFDGTSPLTSVNDNGKVITFSTFLNVTIVEVIEPVADGRPKPGDNVTVNVTVLYGNGSAVTGLVLGNFSIADTWINGTARPWEGMTSNTTFYAFDFTQNGSGIYVFNYTIPDHLGHESHSSYDRCYAEYGLHYIRISAVENASGHQLSGTSPNDGGSYYMMAPYIRVYMNSFDMDPGDPKTYKTFTVYNDGSINFTNLIELTIARTPTSGLTIGLDENNISVSDITDDMFETMTNIAWFNPSAEGTYTVELNASTTYDGHLYYYTRKLTVEVENTSSGDGDDDSNQQQTTYACTTNASCSSTKWCYQGECIVLECPEGYYASNHVCKLRSVYEVEIDEYPHAVYALQGGTADANVSVGNTGNQDLTLMLEVEHDASGVNATASPASLQLLVGETDTFSAHFDVPANTTIGNYSSKFVVTTSSTARDTASFTLVIQPLAETIEQLKADYENMTRIVEQQILADFNSVKLSGLVTGENLTLLEAKVNATMLLFGRLKAAMDSDDYILASSLLKELETLVKQTRGLMDELGVASVVGAEFWNTVIMWLVVGIVCIGAVGLLIYMLVPPQGYSMGRGYGAAGRGSVIDRAKGMLGAVKGKMMGIRGGGGQAASANTFLKRAAPAYKSGYNKLGTGYKPQPTSLKDKMKGMIKKQ
ncbi:MAG: hypothetical protein JXC85_04220 [Candidatus Aenigmarchaeota archaeon]|nr:hypothetical protein [Candidatus Aenigmarchaeota archaeon]